MCPSVQLGGFLLFFQHNAEKQKKKKSNATANFFLQIFIRPPESRALFIYWKKRKKSEQKCYCVRGDSHFVIGR